MSNRDGGVGMDDKHESDPPFTHTPNLPTPPQTAPPSQGLQRGASDTSTASSGEMDAEGRRARMRSRANSATFSIQEELHFDLDPDFDVSATHLVKLVGTLLCVVVWCVVW